MEKLSKVQAKSLKQWRFMSVIQRGGYDPAKAPDRGGPPKQIADQFTSPGSGAPEYAKGNKPSRGGSWTHKLSHKWHGNKGKEAKEKGNHEDAAEHQRDARFHDKAMKEKERATKRRVKYGEKKKAEAIKEGDYKKRSHYHKVVSGHKTGEHLRHKSPYDIRSDKKGWVTHTARHEHQHAGGMKPKSRSPRFKKEEEAFEDFYKGLGVGTIVLDDQNRILIGKQHNGMWGTPGGHVEEGETFEDAALRELNEETGINAKTLGDMVHESKEEGNTSRTFLVRNYSGKPKNTDEMFDHKFVSPHELPDNMRPCSMHGIKAYLSTVKKSLPVMVAIERLEKNILRGADGRAAVYEMTHADSLKLIGSGAFKMLKNITKDMKDEDFKKVNVGEYVFHIRKHLNDVYSGRVEDGHKLIHQFTNRSLPQITADLMSLFEWYAPEDEDVFNYITDDMDDEVVHGGIQKLMDNYKRHNIGEIYQEMDQIREEIRRGMATDLQQVEARMMKLFDKLDKVTLEISEKQFAAKTKSDKDVAIIEQKLAELQSKLDELSGPKRSEVSAVSAEATPHKSSEILDEYYPYLPKPEVHISPDGKIKIIFGDKWTHMEKENFLNDLKAKVITKK